MTQVLLVEDKIMSEDIVVTVSPQVVVVEVADPNTLATAADAAQTAADRIQTGLDVVAANDSAVEALASEESATAQAVIATEKAVLTAADAVATGEDRVQTGLDAVATGEDRVQTGLDVIATNASKAYIDSQAPKILNKTEVFLSMLHGITWTNGWLAVGVPNGNTSYKSTDFIPVVAGDVYCTNIVFSAFTFYYNSAKAVVGSGVALTSGTSFTVPSGTGIAYIRLCTTNAVYNQTVSPPTYPPYIVHAASLSAAGGYFPPNASTSTLDSQGDIDAITAIAEAVPSDITSITETTLNHINAATNSVGYLNSTGAITAIPTYFCTDFIPVKTGKTYTTNCVPVYSATYTGYYNKYGNLISLATLAATAGSLAASSPATFTITDPNVAFIRISSAVGVPNKMMTDGSTMPSTFQPYKAKKLAFPATITRDLDVYGLDGLKWACYGDSITSIVAAAAINATNYHQQIAAKTGIIPIDYGIGGSRIARPTGITITDCMTDRIPSGDVTADIITLMGGVNDATSSLGVTPLGVMADRTTTTFYGALHVACLALLARFPSKGIGLITQTPRHSYMSAQIPYVNAMIEVAQYYSIPCLDLNRSSGLYPDSVYYYTNYFGDTNPDAYGLHPNTIGHSVIARQILQFIMKLKPL